METKIRVRIQGEIVATLMGHEVQAFRADGTKGVCSVMGDLDFAMREAKRLVAECGYARCEVTTWECCERCKGSGRLPKRRGKKVVPYAWLTCPACEGNAFWEKGPPIDPANELVTYEDRGASYAPKEES